MKYFAAVVIIVSLAAVRFWNAVTFFARIFIEVRTSGDNLSTGCATSGHYYNLGHSRRASARVFIYTQLLFLDMSDANSRS
jgi:hypothetical protein